MEFDWISFLTVAGVMPIAVIIASLLGAGIGSIAAFRAIANNRAVARRRATVDIIEKVEYSDQYAEAQASFRYCQQKGFGEIADPETPEDQERRAKVLRYLNHYELISIGIKANTIDEQIYKKWMGTSFIRDWNSATKHIQNERWNYNSSKNKWEYTDTLYENFGDVARAWSEDAIVLSKNFGGPPEKPKRSSGSPIPRVNSENQFSIFDFQTRKIRPLS